MFCYVILSLDDNTRTTATPRRESHLSRLSRTSLVTRQPSTHGTCRRKTHGDWCDVTRQSVASCRHTLTHSSTRTRGLGRASPWQAGRPLRSPQRGAAQPTRPPLGPVRGPRSTSGSGSRRVCATTRQTSRSRGATADPLTATRSRLDSRDERNRPRHTSHGNFHFHSSA